MSSVTLADLLNSLDQGALLLLPSERAAREVNSAFDDRQRSRGLSAWEPAQALSWSQWVRSLWSQLVVTGAEKRLLLNRLQEHQLWRKVVADYASRESIASIDSLAALAQSAWQLAAAYRAIPALHPFRLQQSSASQDSRIFAEWADSFAKLCTQQELLSLALLEEALAEHLRCGRLTAPPNMCLVGFHEKTPAQEKLLSELQAPGTVGALSSGDPALSKPHSSVRATVITQCDLESPAAANPFRAAAVASHESEELLLAARWVRQFLEEAQATGQPTTRVAMVLPNPAQERSALESVLRQVLTPELQSVHADLSSTPWQFSSGSPLSSLAIITDALELIRWTMGPLSLERVSSLLLSPYLGNNGTDPQAVETLARFDAHRLRRLTLLRSEISISAVLEQSESRSSLAAPPDLLTALGWLRRVQEYARQDLHRAREYAQWMEFLHELVQSANWPGARPLTAAEFGAVQAWEDALNNVSTLDFSGARVSFETAWQALEWQLQQAALLPASPQASVQIMSVAETDASVFDAVVLLRFTDQNWPPSEQPHPLLPWALQRSLNMPGTDFAAAGVRSSSRLERLLHRTANILFTYAAQDESGKLRPSPVLETLQAKQMDGAKLLSASGSAPPSEETIPCQTVPDDEPLPPLPPGDVGGGATLLRLQAACGFLAFAQFRLASSEVERGPLGGELGLDARESGSLLHRTLQQFWKAGESQDKLRHMSPDDLETNLTQSIETATQSLRPRGDWDHAYLSLLKQRLRTLLQQWLTEQELQRGPFRVLDVERQESVSVGRLTLDVRVDRIDQVQNGFFLVDYKTGSGIHTGLWDGDRPDDPQLPLYALLSEAEELKGLAFACIRAGEQMKWVGYQAEEGILPSSGSRSGSMLRDMALLQNEWRQTLTQLAEQFAQGRAEVSPKNYKQNCVTCAQRLLCRINQSASSAILGSMDADAEGEADTPQVETNLG